MELWLTYALLALAVLVTLRVCLAAGSPSAEALSALPGQAVASVVREVRARETHTASVIFLHGLGDTGPGWEHAIQSTIARAPHLPCVKWVLPIAAARPVSLSMGVAMAAWYDVFGLDEHAREDDMGIRETAAFVRTLIAAEVGAGIAPSRVFLAGFSQGGAIALFTALTHDVPLGGAIVLSSYLPLRAMFPGALTPSGRATPVFMAHGDRDTVVAYRWGVATAKAVRDAGVSIEFNTVRGTAHTSSTDELLALQRWLETRLGGAVDGAQKPRVDL